jgi:hypothetical protein
MKSHRNQQGSTRRALTRRGLTVESLEVRSLLAGNITAAVTEGVLVVKGDDAANGAVIRQIVEPSTVAGQPPVVKWAVGGSGADAPGGVTTINGATERFLTSGPIKSVLIEMGKGDDNLVIANPRPTDATAPLPKPVVLPGNPIIALGEGNDSLSANIANGGFLNIIMGAGDDKTAIFGSQLNSMRVDGDVPPPPPNAPAAEPVIGADKLSIENTAAKGPVNVDMGSGNDGVSITGRTGFQGPLAVRLGAGNDAVRIGNTPVEGSTTVPPAINLAKGLIVAGGFGDDKVGLHGIVATGKIGVETNEGADEVVIARVSATDGIFAALGSGNDKLTVSKSRAPKGAFNGGEGTDLFTNGGENQFAELLVTNFEAPPAAV